MKYMNVSLIDAMQEIVDAHTKAYKSDFLYDKEALESSKGKTYVWLSRECGTWLLPVDKLFTKDSAGYITYLHYADHERDGVNAYVIEQLPNGMGNIYEVDLVGLGEFIKNNAVDINQDDWGYDLATTIRLFQHQYRNTRPGSWNALIKRLQKGD